MKIYKIRRFSPHKTALTVACVMALSSVILLIPMALTLMVTPDMDVDGNPVQTMFSSATLIALPILCLIMGYIMALFCIWIYNFVALYTGGFQIEMETDQEE